MRAILLAASGAVFVIGACAKQPDNIAPRFATSSPYRAMDCSALNDERSRIASELQRITELQRENANADAALMTVGAIIFWPALIGLAATTDRSDQIASMMGERDAMELVAREKSCSAPGTITASRAQGVQPNATAGPAPASVMTAVAGGSRVAASGAFQCPAAGTRVQYGTSGAVVFHGADPNDAAVCLVTLPNGRAERRLYNYATLPLADERAVRVGLARLFPLDVGRSTEFIFIGTTTTLQTFQYRETWRVLRHETVSIAGAERNAAVVEQRQAGMFNNNFDGSTFLWIDLETGVFLKRRVELRRGSGAPSPFEALRIDVPSRT